METSSPDAIHPTEEEENVDNFIAQLPTMTSMETTTTICKWHGFWFLPGHVKSAITFRSKFHARDDDVFLASSIKTGTTWLKSLCHTIYHQAPHTDDDSLATENPHSLVPTIESIFMSTKPPPFDPYDAAVPRLLHTHLPYALLPDSLKSSKGKIVYIARNPKDTVISMWHYFSSYYREPFSLEKTVQSFCSGDHLRGPFFEHVVGYFLESKKRPEKVLFLKYEELKSDPRKQISRIAEFLGRPFGDGGEAADEIVRRCCLGRLKNLEVNKKGSAFVNASNSIFFRKGEIGDWKNYLSPEMELQINQTCRIRLEPFGLFL